MGFVRCRCQVFWLYQDGRCDTVEQGFCKFIKLRNTNKSNQPLNHEVRTASLRHWWRKSSDISLTTISTEGQEDVLDLGSNFDFYLLSVDNFFYIVIFLECSISKCKWSGSNLEIKHLVFMSCGFFTRQKVPVNQMLWWILVLVKLQTDI